MIRIGIPFKKAVRLLGSVVEHIEISSFSLGGFALSFTALIIIRILVESGVNAFATDSFAYHFFEFSHTFLFFLFAFLVFLPIARFAGAVSWTRAANLLLFGFLIVWTPPILDKMIFGDGMFWSFYELDGIEGLVSRFFAFFGDTPNIGITYGVRIEVAVIVLGMTLYSLFRSRKISRALQTGLLTYVAFFVLGTFPSYVAIPALAPTKGLLEVSEADVAGFILTPKEFLGADMADPRMSLSIRMSIVYALLSSGAIALFLYRTRKEVFFSLLKNVRFPQAIWHGGLLLLGMGLAVIFTGTSFRPDFFEILGVILLIGAVESAWFASVVVNDFADRAIDRDSNPDRPLPSGTVPDALYREIGALFFAASLFFAGIVSMKAMLLLLAYQAIAFLYSAPPFRLKRVPIVATAISAVAGLTVFLSGFAIISPLSDISPVPPSILVFLSIAYAATLPLKDFKDIAGDRKDRVHTIPVILGPERAKAAIGTALFLCYVASPVVLREPELVVPSILFGSIAFLVTAGAGRTPKGIGSFRVLPAEQMAIIILYGAVTAFLLLR